jgi:hypothetical protein
MRRQPPHIYRSKQHLILPKKSETIYLTPKLNLAILAQVMGHGTIVTTMRYVAKIPTYQQQAMDAMATDLAGLLGQPEPTPPEPETDAAPDVIEFPLDRAVGE